MNSIQIYYKMGTILMNSKNSKISDPHRLILNIKSKFKGMINTLFYQKLASIIHRKIEHVIQK